MSYHDFLARKLIRPDAIGLSDIPALPLALKPFQRDIVTWALRRGRAAVFAGTGLGKTPMQLSWAKAVFQATGRPVLVLAPLAVAQQTVQEARKFAISSVEYAADMSEICSVVVVTNYDRAERFDLSRFGGIVLDESSILKAHDSKTRAALTARCKDIPYKLCCTATPAPNDYVELGNHAEFLGVLSAKEMLATFFVHDGSMKATNVKNHGSKPIAEWRLKGHADQEFWAWLSTWSVMLRHPRELGYEDAGYDLPPLHKHQITVPSDLPLANTLMERRRAARASIEDRCRWAADFVNAYPDRPWSIWCNLNDESALLASLIPGSVEVRGSDHQKYKEAAARWFKGEICRCQLPTKEGRIIKNGLNRIKNTFSDIAKRPGISETRDDVSCTPLMKTCVNKHVQTQENGHKIIQTKRLLKTLDILGSRSQIIRRCYSNNGEVAGYAGLLNHLISLKQSEQSVVDGDYTSIIATRQEKFEDCCAPRAISVSENSETVQNYSLKRLCTCGLPNEKSRVLISKGSIFGFGLNFQICSDTVLVGLNDSFEQLFQLIRRHWRFGQTRPVNAYMVAASSEGNVVANLEEKERAADRMAEEMSKHTRTLMTRSLQESVREFTSHDQKMQVPDWLTVESQPPLMYL